MSELITSTIGVEFELTKVNEKNWPDYFKKTPAKIAAELTNASLTTGFYLASVTHQNRKVGHMLLARISGGQWCVWYGANCVMWYSYGKTREDALTQALVYAFAQAKE